MSLTSLTINSPNLTEDGLKHLRDLKLLVDLRISSPLDDQAIRSLVGIATLRSLTVYLDNVTPDTAAALGQIPANVTLQVLVPHEQPNWRRGLERQLPKARIMGY